MAVDRNNDSLQDVSLFLRFNDLTSRLVSAIIALVFLTACTFPNGLALQGKDIRMDGLYLMVF